MTSGNSQSGLLTTLRPAQWSKNAFVLTPLVFGGKLADAAACGHALVALLFFCAVSSAVYILNDIFDRREDSRHQVKRHRPIASGAVPVNRAAVAAALLLAVGLIGACWLGGRFVALIGLYAAIHVAYSLGLKRLAILDVMLIAAGFVLRILGGSVVVGVAPSHWLLLCTIFIALFLGFTKRRAELVGSAENGLDTRAVLKDYSIGFLDQVTATVTGATLICYALYTVDAQTVERVGGRGMLLTIAPVIYGVFRYLYLTYHLEKGEDPTGVMLRDLPMILTVIVWAALAVLVVHGNVGTF